MTPDIALLRKAVEWAEAEAAKTDGTCLWDQRFYSQVTHCGTAFCIAGYVAANLPNAEVILKESSHPRAILKIDGVENAWWDIVAQNALGLTDREADLLFDGSNTIEDVRKVAEQIAARAGERL